MLAFRSGSTGGSVRACGWTYLSKAAQIQKSWAPTCKNTTHEDHRMFSPKDFEDGLFRCANGPTFIQHYSISIQEKVEHGARHFGWSVYMPFNTGRATWRIGGIPLPEWRGNRRLDVANEVAESEYIRVLSPGGGCDECLSHPDSYSQIQRFADGIHLPLLGCWIDLRDQGS